jgi:hypothetical protein
MLYYIYTFALVEPSLQHWEEANLVMVNDLSDMLSDLICHHFIKDFCINIKELRKLVYTSLFGCVFVQFWDECNTGFIE